EYKAVPTVTDPPEVEPTETPEPTEIPELGNSWVCSADDGAKKTGDLVMNGLSLLFDVSSSGKSAITIDGKSFTNYISSANNGSWAGSSGTASGTAFKYVAPADGTFTIYVYKLGSNKELCITKEGVKENKTAAEGTAAYYKNTSGDVENKSLSLDVKKGETYYTYVAGSKGSFVGAELVTTGAAETPQPTGTPNPTSTPQPDTTPDPNAKGAYIGSTKYDTVTAALASITTTPASESDRVYIDLMPGVYREQVVVNKPYVTIRKKAGTEGEAKITWYYGMGSLYDSCNASGYYDESAIGDRESYRPSDWGAALKVSKNANNFTAENITLENSYNRYYTTEELTDITGVDPDTNNSMFHRLDWITEQKEAGKTDDYINDYLKTRTIIDYKGVSSSPRERSAAFHSSADRVQVINCEIISTQDTMGINTGRIYFKDCTIGGTTDYICGSATAVFDNCTLFTNAGNSNNGSGESATITAPANPATSDGYLFYNCTIDGTQYATAGDLGRPWGENVAAAYINTTINHSKLNTSTLLIKDAGWTNMSGNKAEDARFKEYGSVDDTGAAVDTSKRTKGTILNEWTMLRYNPFTFTKGTDNWDPANVSSNYDGVNSVIADTTIDTSDGSTNEITLPSAPAGYEFYWESDSEFALVNDDKTKITLIRPAYGENAIKTTVKLYARKADDTKIGAEKSIEFNITPTSDTENVFTVSGSVNLAKASDSAQTVTLAVKKDSAVIKTETVTVPAGETSKSYTMENIPVGSYTIYPTAENAEYNITTEPKEITGAKGNTVTYDVNISKMETTTVTDGDFETLTPPVTTADGFTASLYTVTDSETANLGTSGDKVYKLTKDEGKTVAKNVGVSFDLKSLLRNGT
ncbi:MAG: hypothetical protein IJL81_06830, partial [Clostridia bacterium]|nr:hypothetical protein [Clostridia bacterium]